MAATRPFPLTVRRTGDKVFLPRRQHDLRPLTSVPLRIACPRTAGRGSQSVKRWGISSVGRASGWQPEGQGFESPILHSKTAAQETLPADGWMWLRKVWQAPSQPVVLPATAGHKIDRPVAGQPKRGRLSGKGWHRPLSVREDSTRLRPGAQDGCLGSTSQQRRPHRRTARMAARPSLRLRNPAHQLCLQPILPVGRQQEKHADGPAGDLEHRKFDVVSAGGTPGGVFAGDVLRVER